MATSAYSQVMSLLHRAAFGKWSCLLASSIWSHAYAYARRACSNFYMCVPRVYLCMYACVPRSRFAHSSQLRRNLRVVCPADYLPALSTHCVCKPAHDMQVRESPRRTLRRHREHRQEHHHGPNCRWPWAAVLWTALHGVNTHG